MKRLCICTLIIALVLSLAACGGNAPAGGTEPPVTKSPAAQKAPAKPADSLSALRADMKPPVMAVADFGFPELSEEFGIMDYLMDEFPNWMAEHDFIGKIPEDHTILTCGYEDWGNLVCIVPHDPEASVFVHVTQYSDQEPYEQMDTVYRAESGDPILLLASTAEKISVSVDVIDSSGRGATWEPYWGISYPIPEDGYYGALVMDFSPISEKTAYQNAVAYGWTVPDISILKDSYFHSDFGYELSLSYIPGEIYDGEAYIFEDRGTGAYHYAYYGYWRYDDGLLHLDMESYDDSSIVIQDAFPVLTDPYGEGWLGIYCTEDGAVLPCFLADMDYDELIPLTAYAEDPYSYALSQGGRVPELSELTDSFWLSFNYALELLEDAVPGDNGGDAILYDVDEIGAYTKRYSGTWSYEDGLLHLMLLPENGDGYFIDDNFPILMLNGELWIGLSAGGQGLPHFQADQLSDLLEQPKG